MNRLRRLLADLDRWIERHRLTRVGRRAGVGFMAHDALQYAGSMAYFSVLSIFQLFVLGVVVASYFVGEGQARRFLVEQIELGTPLDPEMITAVIDAIIESRGGIGVIGLVFLAWGALGLFSALSKGVARVFPQGPPRPFLKDKLVGLALISVTGLLAVASVVIGLVTALLLELAGGVIARVPISDVALAAFGLFVPLVLVFVAFAAIYRIVPNRPVSLAEVWPGALVAAILWSVLRVGFTYYATEIARYDSAFGPISTGITLIVFLYFASVVVLLGAEVARANVVDDELAALSTVQAPPAAGPEQPPRPAAQRRPIPRWAWVAGAVIAGIFLGRKSRNGG
jgi:membrane protein